MGEDPKEHRGERMVMKRRARIKPPILAAVAAAIVVLASTLVSFSQSASDVDDIRNAVVNGSVEEKRQALYDLRVIGTNEAARAALPALSDRDEVIRATAAGVVALLPPDEASIALIPLLSDKKPFVRKEACLALGAARAINARDGLIRVLERDGKPDVRAAAATALGLTGNPASVAALTRALERRTGSKNAYLRRESAFAIGRISESSVGRAESSVFPESFLPSKYKSKTDHRPDGFDGAAPTLIRLLSSLKEPAEVRRASAFALGAIGAHSARKEIEKCSASEDPYLAETCREARAKLSR